MNQDTKGWRGHKICEYFLVGETGDERSDLSSAWVTGRVFTLHFFKTL